MTTPSRPSSKKLSKAQKYVLQQKGTEPPFSGEYLYHDEDGVYRCAACDAALFSSKDKMESHSGWPSFSSPHTNDSVITQLDTSHGMVRTEVNCANCGGHLGHVFDMGKSKSSQSEKNELYCINSLALDFEKKPEKK